MTDLGDITAGIRGTGVEQHVDGGRLDRGHDRLDELVRVAELGGDHVWVATVAHHVVDPDLALAGEFHLDAESILFVGIGRYVCEQPYNARLRQRRCPGEPR